ncbi:hypothetical protein N7478_008714 [Penicillium angulare]|uniref:uncharacterized protein n=1 Tax=Penicillium angulare TaxID=116970 RepID=UPI00253FF3F5|nr:uncharacterized protein N7478_008714 [Penicillium angulare]KAJ5273589.1 hypothetical protein N7478_008714 [Penicillium angulare]
MGRWGRRMFEGDSDLGLLADLENHVGIKEKGEHSMEDMIMMRMPDEKVKYVREKLGTSSYGETLLTNCKSKDLGWNGKHCTVILGAVMIAAGAHTSSENMQHLRKPVPQINCNTGYTMALFDEGFRAPGRPQFIAALDHYQPGIARSVRDLRIVSVVTGSSTNLPAVIQKAN